MKRMILATVIVIISIAGFIMSYSLIVWPVEYTIDTLQDVYGDLSTEMGYNDSDDLNKTMGALPYFLGASVIVGIAFSFVWYFAYGQKKEYEQD